jgi:galactose-1-phosphate uridylyltransferase
LLEITSKFLSPSKDLEEQIIEYRRDGLTKIGCRINIKRAQRVKQARQEVDFSELIQKSSQGCFFCPENIEKATPKFLPEIIPEGRIVLGETTVFPNLFPFAEHHAVAAICKKHFLDLNEFTQKQIEDALAASLDYFKRIKKAKYFYINWNHLPPSGASIVHPHLQLLADNKPTYLLELYLRASAAYYKKYGENYWLKLIKNEEELGKRFIARTGSIAWLAAYAPLGNNEVIAIFEDASSIMDLEHHISHFAKGLKKILAAYSNLGVRSFTLTTYSAPEKASNFCLNARLVSRPSPQRYYTSDSGFMETLHHERVAEHLPEKLAEYIRKFF